MCNQTLSGRIPCAKRHSLRLWCPTWTSAENGPLNLCVDCARVFQPENNPNNNGKGSFHWGNEADTAFHRCEIITRKTDRVRYENTKGMIERGQYVCGKLAILLGKYVAIIDNEAWLLTYNTAVNLGQHTTAKDVFPKIFEY